MLWRWTAYSVCSSVKERKRGTCFRFSVRKWQIFLIQIKIFLYLPSRTEATRWELATLRFKHSFSLSPAAGSQEVWTTHGGEEILLSRALLTYLAKRHPGQRPCSSLFCWEFVLWRERLNWVGKLLVILPCPLRNTKPDSTGLRSSVIQAKMVSRKKKKKSRAQAGSVSGKCSI